MCFADFNLDLKTVNYLFQEHEKRAKYAQVSGETVFKDYIGKIKVFPVTEATSISKKHFHNSADTN